ncbi:uncharacterized protein LOC126670179 [Mercurialis annua]|uniref:uncharacterized protein LOC126670179 n=1 Tax=Mercurialis annua TaxID=3986 RepID=UPI00215EF13A|nr:uncharacterized protein LOC126670179 [Mercurialis annua]XP_055960874.1 uncharacterized protein LOC126670179 [Mercurialis annua]
MAIFIGGDFKMERRRLEECSCLIKNCFRKDEMPTPKMMRICGRVYVNEGLKLSATAEQKEDDDTSESSSAYKMTMYEIENEEHKLEDIELEWMFEQDDEMFTTLFPVEEWIKAFLKNWIEEK